MAEERVDFREYVAGAASTIVDRSSGVAEKIAGLPPIGKLARSHIDGLLRAEAVGERTSETVNFSRFQIVAALIHQHGEEALLRLPDNVRETLIQLDLPFPEVGGQRLLPFPEGGNGDGTRVEEVAINRAGSEAA